MGLVLPPIEAYHVQHLPLVKAYADKIGLVEVINQVVPTEMDVDPGTIVLGIILDTLCVRIPLYRLAGCPLDVHPRLELGQAGGYNAMRLLDAIYGSCCPPLERTGVRQCLSYNRQ